MIVTCSNIDCEAQIEIPDGVSYVVCDDCDTWNFPPSDFAGSPSSSTPGGDETGYQSPPMGDDSAYTPPYSGSEDYVVPESQGSELSYAGVPPLTEQDSFSAQPEPAHEAVIPDARQFSNQVGSLVLPDGQRLGLSLGRNVIGRHCGALSILDPTVSRKHCIIEVNPDHEGAGMQYFIYDIGAVEEKASTNGVFIYGRSLRLRVDEKIPLTNGMSIYLGSVCVTVEI